MERILVTGGSGMVGSNFIQELSEGLPGSCHGLASQYHSHETSFRNCANIRADITQAGDLPILRDFNPDLIIHCAALTNISYCEANGDEAYRINVLGSRNAARLARESGAKLAYISTDAVFDGLKGNYSEEDDTSPVNVYGRTKQLGEIESLKYKRTIVARISVFGRNLVVDRGGFAEDIVSALSNGRKFTGFFDAKTSIMYVRDAIRHIMALCKKDACGIYHIGGTEPVSKLDFAYLAADVFGLDRGLISRGSIESLYPVDGIRRSRDCSFNVAKMLRTLGIRQTPSVREMLEEYRLTKVL
ncbi:MAG: SDR family oxidoreductase [archaeon]